ncbi:CapA domain protein [Thermoclostridium stercorarium subsp. stercorarium DSM 8532]|jgi:poly-gamma-glutamate capsule biosynthesis protein CapA/YwtB (metallophosphatase superfamily)|uniref:CapA domain protein n=3 Tax=Thermoclostridium stercorarium TaxID=1510 RepID=L7VNM4_THES1|nr:CapA family protein [Thermoclostridium stercorarium]AGC68377.1 CapA domain protein [Thermoclostridium stercorarium subsp. stercorarium DSM 8532]AGI39400.1 poly-gamma-glutamate biosynthesis enzyme [Thermoclostridium stercorarium subsp. stercorarium DSM 8532]ANW98717.1 capsule biosynthesis protein CapA [Thermoclostridium stercorarium subsp. thermolacticum DSM 2910]ANX01258.1 capsule biosynthesis protein CapA [Thermoclostridium stercorarium subsp. leptospartum DSM 9219]UZQ86884.1 CapA family p
MKKIKEIFYFIIVFVFFSACTLKADVTAFRSQSVKNTPVPTPTTVPTMTPTPTPTPAPVTATILAAGDVIMHEPVVKSGKNNTVEYNYNYIFDRIKPFVEEADLSIIDFEGACMETDTNYTGYPLFNAPPAIITAFAYAGFDMVNTANNHCLDRGLNGLFETRDIIKRNNLQVIGTFEDASEPRYTIRDLNGIKVGFLSYTYGCNMNENRLTEEERNIHLSLIDRDKIKNEIESLSSLVDVVVVLMHWGVEYRVEPTAEQTELADMIFSAGADIILGSHPHVIERSEIRETDGKIKYIIYSMGNFLSNQIDDNNPETKLSELTQENVMVKIKLEKDLMSGQTRIVSVKHIPAWVHRYSENNVYKYSIIPIPSLENEIFNQVDEKLAEKLKSSYIRTMEKMQDFR